MTTKIESGHGVLFLSQIIIPKEESNIPTTSTDEISKSLTHWGFNIVPPIVCLTDEEEKYRLLTGLAIYEAAKKVGLKEIWVFLVAAKQSEAEKAINDAKLQSTMNERLLEFQDIEGFLNFLNDVKSPLTSIPGIKDGYAKLIKNNRNYNSLKEVQTKLGAKRSLNWLKAWKMKHSK